MKEWVLWTNALPQFKHGTVEVIDMPLWLWLIDWWSDHGCSFIPRIPFPNFPKRKWDKEEDDELLTPKEYWGDLSQWYCGTVCMPLTQWVFTHPKRKSYQVDIGYDKLKEIFKEYDPEQFKRSEEILTDEEVNDN